MRRKEYSNKSLFPPESLKFPFKKGWSKYINLGLEKVDITPKLHKLLLKRPNTDRCFRFKILLKKGVIDDRHSQISILTK